MPLIDRNSPVPYYQQVFEQIAQGITDGLYPPGKRLPSIRECARELGVSNTTIELAYQKLTEQGYVYARRGSGYTICEVDAAPAKPTKNHDSAYRAALARLEEDDRARSNEQATNALQSGTPLYDFAYDTVDATLFPFTTWARISREVFFSKGAERACLYNDRQGLYELREQISRYIGSEYGLTCSPSQIIVMSTTRELVSSIMALFDPAKTTFAMENPCYDEVRLKLSKSGYEVRPLSVFPFPTWEQAQEVIDGADIVFTTPACQFPSNHLMPMELRQNLVQWAKRTGAYVIDDEYGWEFQSGVSRTPPLAALDNAGRVITTGTFSNSFTPAVCLSYAVLPPDLMLKWREVHLGSHPQVPWQTQAAMAAFMRDGHWRKHVRKIRTAMQRKRQTLISAIEKHMGDSVEVLTEASSLFVLIKTDDGRDESQLVQAAAKASVCIYPTSRYWQGDPPDDWRYVLVGYAGIEQSSIEHGIEALASAWKLPG